MTKELVPDTLWEVVKPSDDRPGVSNRNVLGGINFVLRSGILREMLLEMGCSGGVTCWHRLRDWQASDVRCKRHQTLLDSLGEANQVDWSRASVDTATFAAKEGQATKLNPTDKSKQGSKLHHVVERRGNLWLRAHGIRCRIARKGIESKDRWGRWCWIVEWTHSWLGCYWHLECAL
jgi:hypothetical protein